MAKQKQMDRICLTTPTTTTQTISVAQTTNDEWSPSTAGPITTWTAPLVGKGKLAVQPFAFYNITRGEFDSQGHYHSLPAGDSESQFQEQFFAQYGITDRLELDAQTVYQEYYIKQDGEKAHDEGFGDSYLFSRYQILDDKGWVPTVDGLLQLKMPTGKYQHLDADKLGTDSTGASTGGGSWDTGFGLMATKKLNPFLVHADIIYSIPQEVRVNGAKTIYGNYLNCDAAVEYILPKGFNLMMELNGLIQGDRWQDGAYVPSSDLKSLTFAPGIGWSNDKIQTLIAYQRVLTGTNTDANDSIVATFVYNF